MNPGDIDQFIAALGGVIGVFVDFVIAVKCNARNGTNSNISNCFVFEERIIVSDGPTRPKVVNGRIRRLNHSFQAQSLPTPRPVCDFLANPVNCIVKKQKCGDRRLMQGFPLQM